MPDIVDNERYRISADAERARLYLQIKGYWARPDQVSDFVSDLSRAADTLPRGFTLLADLREMRPHPPEVLPVHQAAQAALLAAGLSSTAEVLHGAVTAMQTDRLSKETGMAKREFADSGAAERWLDSLPSARDEHAGRG